MGGDHNIRKAKERMVPAKKKKKTDQKVKLSMIMREITDEYVFKTNIFHI